jgi:hypothetical protein
MSNDDYHSTARKLKMAGDFAAEEVNLNEAFTRWHNDSIIATELVDRATKAQN